jgi:thiamine biosynthesis lipoprotein
VTDLTEGAGTDSLAEVRFTAMGSSVHVVVVGGDSSLTRWARDRVDTLEQRWSRFIADSEVSQLNAHSGRPVLVSRETYHLVELAVVARERTNGAFDPTMLGALVELGYDRSFERVVTRAPVVAPGPSHVREPGGITLDPMVGTVTLDAGSGFDPGGIGKGLAADLVTAELLERGASGALVNVGGDLMTRGRAPRATGWSVEVEDPTAPERHVARVLLRDGAVCTSSRVKRSWTTTDGASVHHLLDPHTGRPYESSLVAATVVAGEAWWAEALTKAVFAAGHDAPNVIANAAADALLVHDDGTLERIGRPDVFAGAP